LIRSRILRVVAAATVVGAGIGVVSTTSGADTTLVSCTGITSLAKLNPTIKSGDAKYIKAASSGTTGSCTVDAGIRNNQTTQDPKYVLDDQAGGHSTLSVQKGTGTLSGSVSCNSTDPSLITDYPASYPLQGKLIYKFNELDAALKQIQMQAYVRGGRDNADPNPTNFTIKGIVIKGPGVGGDLTTTLSFFPNLADTHNVNFLDCVANPATRNGSLASLFILPSDGSDAGTAVDPLAVTIPS